MSAVGSVVSGLAVSFPVPFLVPFFRAVFAGQGLFSAVSAVGFRKWTHTRGKRNGMSTKREIPLREGNKWRFNGTNDTASALTCRNSQSVNGLTALRNDTETTLPTYPQVIHRWRAVR